MSGRYRGAVLEDFTDAAVARLVRADRAGFWRTSQHAPDDLVDRLADRIAASPPREVRRYELPHDVRRHGVLREVQRYEVPGEVRRYEVPGEARRSEAPADLDSARVELLLGADTDRALAHLARLGRRSEVVRAMCAARGVWVPAGGPAVRRYASEARTIVTARTGDPRLATGIDAGTVFEDPRGLGCALPLAVPLLVGDTLLPSAVRGGGHPFVMSFCGECDGDEDLREEYRWRLGRFGEARDEVCPGYAPDDERARLRLRLAPAGERRWDDVGQLGGRPEWLRASPQWPVCCGRPMWFVGQLQTVEFGGVGGSIYGFRCECGAAAQPRQMM